MDKIKKEYRVVIKKRSRENLGEPWGWQGHEHEIKKNTVFFHIPCS